MKRILRVMAVGAALTGLLAVSPEASVDHEAYLTFSHPVSLPNVTLAAGTYRFEMPANDLSVVRVSSRDGSTVFFTGFTRITSRPRDVKWDQHVTLGEASRDEAPRIRVWYPPVQRKTGREFIYPR
jgi:hypothetical protein